uniref:Uncharacterized protein n=1 Tax=Oryza sativa subsp. japonica TaxID=39947 RepID=Q651L6_ORYSJ|nr:hypothetical protein [Oryza sativa Japonica Group]
MGGTARARPARRAAAAARRGGSRGLGGGGGAGNRRETGRRRRATAHGGGGSRATAGRHNTEWGVAGKTERGREKLREDDGELHRVWYEEEEGGDAETERTASYASAGTAKKEAEELTDGRNGVGDELGMGRVGRLRVARDRAAAHGG